MKAIELTKNEREILEAIVANAKKVGDSGVEFILQDVARETGKSIRSVSATAGSLAKKGMLLTANGDSYFDGELTEAGLHEVESSKVNNNQEVKTQSNKSKNMATKKAKTVKVEDSKNVTNAVDNFDAPVMDERILKLNEYKAVKMANLSKGKRPVAKEAKELATYILNNWDDENALASIYLDDASAVDKEVFNEIILSRLKNFDDAKKACEEAVKETPKAKTEKKAKLPKTQKDLVEKATKGGKATVEVEVGAGKSGKAKKADSKKAEPKAKEEVKKETKSDKTARKVGDVHPNHPTWIWTEYAEGKFDWRTNPADKKQGQRTDKAATSEKKSEPKKDTKKATNKKVAKGGKVETKKEEKPKELTIDEFVALPVKSAKNGKKPSEAQKEALKLIVKGYRVTADRKFFENAEGDKKACNWESVVAMLRRYGMEYIPVGLVK